MRITSKRNIGSTGAPIFWLYENITLALFIEIAGGGNVNKLVREGTATQEQCAQAWERILKQNSLVSGGLEYLNYFNLYKSYDKLIADYTIVKATLLTLMFVVDDNDIMFLKRKGIKIATTSATQYNESLQAGMRRAEGMVNQIVARQIELAKMQNKDKDRKVSAEELLAYISVELGFAVTDNVTLARYNEYKKLIMKRRKPVRQ